MLSGAEHWITPKTNWQPTDKINYSDFDRIVTNIFVIEELILLLVDIEVLQEYTMGKYPDLENFPEGIFELDFNSRPYVDYWNLAEEMLDCLSYWYYNTDTGTTKIFTPNTPYIDYIELNRLERGFELLYTKALAEYNGLPRLEFTLGRKQLGMR